MTIRVLFPLFILAPALPGQTLDQGTAPGPAASYEQRYAEVMALAPRADRVAQVTSLVLRRDVAEFTLGSGTLYVLSPVGGRTVGAVFRGRGTFSFSPPSRIEQERLVRFERTRSIQAEFTELVLLFADSTLAELEGKLTFSAGEAPGGLRSLVRQSLDYLGDDDSKSFEPDLMAAFLNQDSSGLFYAHINRAAGGPLMLMLNPFHFEGVTLARRPPRVAWTHRPEVICQFPQRGAPVAAVVTSERQSTAAIRDYRMEITLRSTGTADLSFAAAARLEITTTAPAGPWISFELFSKLVVDSARWESGESATVFRGKDGGQVWVKLDRRLRPGEVRALHIYYRGDLIDRYGNFFFIKSSIAWYPHSLEDRSSATFDITYHSPSHYLLASVGDRADSSVAGRVLTTRWVTAGPIRNASFNLGLFENYRVPAESIPPVHVMISEDAHRQLSRTFVQQRRMKETVGADAAQSLKFFQHVYGPLPVSQLHVTEVPDFHGEAFPGLINLSWVTFQQTDQQGEDEVFRAHEVAHQWWGIGVDFATYHDQWLSEGFSNFSGLWYLQTARRDSDKYFGVLRRWRANILLHREEPSPIWLGYRASTSRDEGGFQTLVYEKGAWVLHMLRILMLDLKSMNEDRFTGMMQDFYRTYRGGRASTEDFQRMAERHVGMSLDWFFQEWIYGTDIPTYRVATKTEPAGNGRYLVTLRVVTENAADDFRMYVPVTVDLGQNRIARFLVNVRGPRSEIALPLLPAEPQGVKFNDLDGVLCQVEMVAW